MQKADVQGWNYPISSHDSSRKTTLDQASRFIAPLRQRNIFMNPEYRLDCTSPRRSIKFSYGSFFLESK